MASEGRVGTRTSQIAMGSKSTPEGLNRMIKDLIINEKWGVMMIHGINYGWDAFQDDNILWNHLDSVKKQGDHIWVDTFRAVSAYVKERENNQLNIIKSKRKWIITSINNLNSNLFSHALTMVVSKQNLKRMSVKQDGKRIPVQLSINEGLFDFNPWGGKISVVIK